MKVLSGNITQCGACGRALEYEESDLVAVVECPVCKGLVKVGDLLKPRETEFSKYGLDDYSWDEIHELLTREGADFFMLEAVKNITLKSGETYRVQVTHRDGDGLMFSFYDLYGANEGGGKAINNDDYERDYKNSDLRSWLNGAFYDILPDDLKKYIVPADIVSGGEILKDKVFIPSEMEVFGEQEYGNCEEGSQLELYENWRKRITGYPDGNYGRWWWLRTKSSASARCFCGCYGGGYAGYYRAGLASGVRPHFLIK